VRIHAGSGHGCHEEISGVANDSYAASFVDAWTYHRIGADSDDAMVNATCGDGKPVFSNEYEYFTPDVTPYYTVNIAQNLMNWLTFSESPTWTWLHALKPTYNTESQGFGLGFWRPSDDNTTDDSFLLKNHWRYNNKTWNGLAGFVKHIPWNVMPRNKNKSILENT